MLAIYKKEMRSYFINPIGYVYTGIFLVFSALVACYTTLVSESYSTTQYFTYMIFAFIILIPLLTMRLFAEERKGRTEQLLLTAPVTITGMVMGKYLAALTLYVSTVLISCINFIPIYVIAAAERAGNSTEFTHIGPVTAQLVGSVIALLLLGAAFIAIGTFISSLTENQLSAAVVTIGVLCAMVMLNLLNNITDSDGNQIIGSYVIRAVINWFSVLSRYYTFSYGIFDFAAILYYVSLILVFIFLTIRVYEKRRWG
ncbi:MAG: ABC transporter [Ruminococcaceae bacterium]|nr:ABC transporter [Oscillospiraceae bacterium]